MALVILDNILVGAVVTGSAAEWSAADQPIPKGVLCFEVDSNRFKVGNGASTYAQLAYASQTLTIADIDGLQDKLDALTGGLKYQNGWNAATNTPAIPTASVENQGHFYIVTTAGTTDIDGEADWGLNDWIVSNGTAWTKVDNSEIFQSAEATAYDNTLSGLAATNLQDAVDEVEDRVDDLEASVLTHDTNATVNVRSASATPLATFVAGATVDGVVLAAGKLVWNVTDDVVYEVQASGAPLVARSFTTGFTRVTVSEGLIHGGAQYLLVKTSTGRGNVVAASTGKIVAYANATSGLTAITVQQALDQLALTRAKLSGQQAFSGAQDGTPVAVAEAATITLDLALSNYFTLPVTAARTMANPTNMVVGRSGEVHLTVGASGALAFGSYWKHINGNALALSEGKWILTYSVVSATEIGFSLGKLSA